MRADETSKLIPGGSKIDPQRLQNQPTLEGSKVKPSSLRGVNERPKDAPRAPKSVPRAPKSAARAPKTAPRAAQERPETPR